MSNTEAGTVAARMTQRAVVAALESTYEQAYELALKEDATPTEAHWKAREAVQEMENSFQAEVRVITVSQRGLRQALSGVRMPPPARFATFK
jgi:hypothetical protein